MSHGGQKLGDIGYAVPDGSDIWKYFLNFSIFQLSEALHVRP